jgi:hypothetical protein
MCKSTCFVSGELPQVIVVVPIQFALLVPNISALVSFTTTRHLLYLSYQANLIRVITSRGRALGSYMPRIIDKRRALIQFQFACVGLAHSH